MPFLLLPSIELTFQRAIYYNTSVVSLIILFTNLSAKHFICEVDFPPRHAAIYILHNRLCKFNAQPVRFTDSFGHSSQSNTFTNLNNTAPLGNLCHLFFFFFRKSWKDVKSSGKISSALTGDKAVNKFSDNSNLFFKA